MTADDERLAALTFRLDDTEAALDIAATARDVHLRRIAARDLRIAALEQLLEESRRELVELQAAVLEMAPAWQPGDRVGRCRCKGRDAHLRGPGCAMVVEL